MNGYLIDVVCELVCIAEDCVDGKHFDELDEAGDKIIKALEELQQYKKLKKHGLLFKIPCPVGTEIYLVFEAQGVVRDTIRRWQINKKGLMFGTHGSAYTIDDIGKTVFLSREKAEQALREMRGCAE